MRKILLSLIIFISLLSGCAKQDKPLKLIVSFYILEDFTYKIVENDIPVINILKGNVEAHSYELSSQDMVLLSDNPHWIVLGNHFEAWLDSAKSNIPNASVLVSSKDIDPLMTSLNQIDPHVWLSIPNSILMLEAIKNYVSELVPDKADIFQARYETVKAEFEALNQEYIDNLATRKRSVFLTKHSAFAYLANEYGLTAESVLGIEPSEEPSATRVQTIIDFINQNKIPMILAESSTNDKVVSAIANETGIEVGVLNPIEFLNDEEKAASMDYLSMMRQNLEALKKALN